MMCTPLPRSLCLASRQSATRKRWRPALERLPDRITPAITANFDAASGVLTLTGTAAGDQIIVSRDAGGSIIVFDQDGKVDVAGATVTTTAKINIDGGDGNDDIVIDQSNGQLAPGKGGEGTDTPEIEITVAGGAGADTFTLIGQSGNDIVDMGTKGISINSDADVDVILFFSLDDDVFDIELVVVDGGGGDDLINASAGGTSIVGDPFEISLNILGGDGADTLLGGIGNDTIQGGDGNDLLVGLDGGDSLIGGKGDDTFQFDEFFNDQFEGGQGTDRVVASINIFGNDLTLTDAGLGGGLVFTSLSSIEEADLFGDDGSNILDAKDFTGTVTMHGGGGKDELHGGQNNDSLLGGKGRDVAFGNLGDDTLAGGLGADTLDGGEGNDSIRGGAGNDLLIGLAGDDILLGGPDLDTTEGGDGNDRCVGERRRTCET